MPDLNNLKTIHPGWWLGVVKTNRFEPSHALAMALKAEESRQALCFPVNSQEIRTYLHGESLFTDGPDGWMLVCVALSPCSVAGSAAFPLGWGRRTRGVVKNLYPRGLRWH
jgi:NOL1/NOP2/fmu family ribosome biogenesis protein